MNHTHRNRWQRLLAVTAVAGLAVAACGDDSDDGAASAAQPSATLPADTAAPTTEPMNTEPMNTEPMESSMNAPSGPGCAAVPADGEGSFDGMADDPAATAASNNPVLSTLVGAVAEAGLVDTLNSEGPFTIFAPTTC